MSDGGPTIPNYKSQYKVIVMKEIMALPKKLEMIINAMELENQTEVYTV